MRKGRREGHENNRKEIGFKRVTTASRPPVTSRKGYAKSKTGIVWGGGRPYLIVVAVVVVIIVVVVTFWGYYFILFYFIFI